MKQSLESKRRVADRPTDRVLFVKALAFIGIGLATAGWAAVAPADEIDAPFGGLSLGIHAGAFRGKSSYGTDPACPPIVVDAVFCNAAPDPTIANGNAVAASGSGTMSSDGATGGVQAGYNWQSGRIVYGGEIDFAALDFDESASASGAFPVPFAGTQYTVTNKTTLHWVSTLRARVGATVTPQFLVYATGGAAFTRISVSGSYSDNANNGIVFGGSGSGETSKLKAGWVIGAGAQWALDRQWSVKAEYLHADFGSVSAAVPLTNSPAFTQTISVTGDMTLDLLRVGLDYRF
ncbi:MAG TPA: outer membrane beta-barrel protein [Burkholderiales bacterium]|nr:outer membrane beta-barrel protein [Burkholderiales bacterium]